MNYFVAARVQAPPGLDAALGGAPRSVRRFHPDDLHVTVAFLGPMEPTRAPEVVRAVADLAGEPTPFRFARLVALPSRRKQSALSFELEGPGQRALVELIANHRERLVSLARGRQDDRPPPTPT